MFTGLVETCAEVVGIEQSAPGALRLTLTGKFSANFAAPGASIAISGCCLTVVDFDAQAQKAVFDISTETLRCTTLGELKAGSLVNIERAVLVGSRLGGHMVSGHVDGVGRVVRVTPRGEFREVVVRIAHPQAAKLVIPKGSICIEGVSLTINGLVDSELRGEWVEVELMLIPETLMRTNLGSLQIDSAVNFEFDIIGKYLLRA